MERGLVCVPSSGPPPPLACQMLYHWQVGPTELPWGLGLCVSRYERGNEFECVQVLFWALRVGGCT